MPARLRDATQLEEQVEALAREYRRLERSASRAAKKGGVLEATELEAADQEVRAFSWRNPV